MTEQDKYGMEQLAEYLDMRIRNEEKNIKENRDKLDPGLPLLFCVERGGTVQVPFHGKTIRGNPASNPAGGSSRGGTWIYTA